MMKHHKLSTPAINCHMLHFTQLHLQLILHLLHNPLHLLLEFLLPWQLHELACQKQRRLPQPMFIVDACLCTCKQYNCSARATNRPQKKSIQNLFTVRM